MNRFDEGIESHEIVLAPNEFLFGDEVGHLERTVRIDAEPRWVKVDGCFASRMRIKIGHDEDRVTPTGAGIAAVEILAVDDDRVVIAPMYVEISQLTQSRVLRPDLVQLGEVRRE